MNTLHIGTVVISKKLRSHAKLLFRMLIGPKCTTFVVQMGYTNSIGVHGILDFYENQLWTIQKFHRLDFGHF